MQRGGRERNRYWAGWRRLPLADDSVFDSLFNLFRADARRECQNDNRNLDALLVRASTIETPFEYPGEWEGIGAW